VFHCAWIARRSVLHGIQPRHIVQALDCPVKQHFTGDDLIQTALVPDFEGWASDLWIDAESDEDEPLDDA
jgi:hypothetical protein